MSRSSRWRALAAAALLAAGTVAAHAGDTSYDIGRAPTAAEIAGWNIDVRGDGLGLPPGRGTVKAGGKIFDAHCASCHGDFGEGIGLKPALAGGQGSLADLQPHKTVGSYWPYAPTLFDYIRRAMPFDAPGTLDDDQIYAVIAYILNLNDILPADATLDAKSLAAIKMPNRNGFITKDPRPDIHDRACMSNCKWPMLKITSDLARSLGVTPKENGD